MEATHLGNLTQNAPRHVEVARRNWCEPVPILYLNMEEKTASGRTKKLSHATSFHVSNKQLDPFKGSLKYLIRARTLILYRKYLMVIACIFCYW